MAKNTFSAQEQELIKAAIHHAEQNTSGEIRVHIENKCNGNVLDRAAFIFELLKMHETKQRNGVLFYLAIEDRQFAILGDLGINLKVPKGFWDKISDEILEYFKKEEYVEGLVKGIKEAGVQLKTYFPYEVGDENELEDDISFGD